MRAFYDTIDQNWCDDPQGSIVELVTRDETSSSTRVVLRVGEHVVGEIVEVIEGAEYLMAFDTAGQPMLGTSYDQLSFSLRYESMD